MASDNDHPKRVGIWIRVSTSHQAEKESPEHHARRARMYAESKDWDVVEEYRLEAVSGKSVKDTPQAQQMLRDIKKGHISGLIFSKLARLARNTRELLDFADIFQEHDADLISLKESIDTTTPAGRLFYTIIAAMAQWEREEISERVKASMKTRAKMGKPLGGRAPYGYRWEDSELVPHPEEAPIRKRMYELFLEHRRIKKIARTLNEEGHRTRQGNKFSDTTVRRLLKDPTAKGWHRSNYTRSKGDNKSWELKPEEEWIWNEVEPIISEEKWNRVNEILEERAKKYSKRPGRKPEYLLAGVTYCECGNKMYVRSNSPKYVCRNCRNKIPIEDLHGLFVDQLEGFVFSPDDVRNYLDGAEDKIAEKKDLLETLEEEKREVQREMDKVYQLYIDDEITTEGFGERNQPLEERKTQIDEEIPKLQGEIDFLRTQYLSNDQILTEAQDLLSRWSKLEFDEKRRVVENTVEKIEVGEDEVTIDLFYLPSLSDVPKRQHNHRDSWRQ